MPDARRALRPPGGLRSTHAKRSWAYERALALGGRTPDMLVRNASMRAKSTDGRPEGEPYRHVKEALAVDPNHVAALAFAGHAEAERGDPAVSAALWERLLKQLPTDSPIFARVKDIVGDARKRAAAQPR